LGLHDPLREERSLPFGVGIFLGVRLDPVLTLFSMNGRTHAWSSLKNTNSFGRPDDEPVQFDHLGALRGSTAVAEIWERKVQLFLRRALVWQNPNR